jgi:hypothetical protein
MPLIHGRSGSLPRSVEADDPLIITRPTLLLSFLLGPIGGISLCFYNGIGIWTPGRFEAVLAC